MNKVYTIGLLGIILLQSCGSNHTVSNRMIQKRKYNKGFHIAKRGKLHSKDDTSVKEDYRLQEDSQNSNRTIEANFLPNKPDVLKAEREVSGIEYLEANLDEPHTSVRSISILSEDENCDIIMLKNGDEIEAKVTEIGSMEIKYKQCDNIDGPTYTLSRNDIFKIKYANGKSELISSVETGATRTPMSPASAEQKSRTIRGLSIASIILSIAGTILTLFFWFGPIFTSIAVILALTALTLLLIQPVGERSASVARLTFIATGVSILLPIVGLIILLILL